MRPLFLAEGIVVDWSIAQLASGSLYATEAAGTSRGGEPIVTSLYV